MVKSNNRIIRKEMALLYLGWVSKCRIAPFYAIFWASSAALARTSDGCCQLLTDGEKLRNRNSLSRAVGTTHCSIHLRTPQG